MVKSRTRVLFSWSRIWGNLIMLPFIESSLFFSILVSRNPYTVICTSQEKWYYKTRTKVFRNLTKRNEIKKKKKNFWINKKNTWKLNWLSFINHKSPTKKNKKNTFVSVSSYLTQHFIQTNTIKKLKGGIFVSHPWCYNTLIQRYDLCLMH